MQKTHSFPLGEIVYQVYWRSFKDSDADGIGDLRGVTEKLDYLKELGITAIWLNPFFKSPMKDMGYDISDYFSVDPTAGTLKDFEDLVHKAHNYKIKIIIDLVLNHTSSVHPWFIVSAASKNNPKSNWYTWADKPLNNWRRVIGAKKNEVSAWSYHPGRKQYYLHSFLPEQPDLNWNNPQVRKAALKVVGFWLNRGVDGIRLDAVYWMAKDKKFRDDPINPKPKTDDPYYALKHIYSRGRKELYTKYLKEITEFVKKYPAKFIISEAYTERISTMIRFYNSLGGIGAPFNFNLITRPFSPSIKKFISKFQSKLKKDFVPIYVLGNHDVSRISSRVGDERLARVAAMLLLTLPGMPFIYYGEELGMKDVEIPISKRNDTNEGKLSRDPERTPMQWNNKKYSGFSEVEPWLPVSNEYTIRNVDNLNDDPCSILSLYKQLIKLRKDKKVFVSGEYKELQTPYTSNIAYTMSYKDKQFLIVLNLSKKQQSLKISSNYRRVVINSFLDKNTSISKSHLTLRPAEGVIIEY